MKENKGITLTSLIITIIVMIILGGIVLLTMVTEEGIISKAEGVKAKQKYIEQLDLVKTQCKYLDNRKIDLNVTKENIDELGLEGVNTKLENQKLTVTFANGEKWEITGEAEEIYSIEELKIGDYVAYTPNNKESYTVMAKYSGHIDGSNLIHYPYMSMKWKILDIDKSKQTIQLISETIHKGKSYSHVTFAGQKMYNNIVGVLNEFCDELYSNPSIGAKARSINIEDIQDKIDPAKFNYKNYTNYGKEKILPAGSYPYQYKEDSEKGLMSSQTALTTSNTINLENGTVMKSNYWRNDSSTMYKMAQTRNGEKSYYNLFSSDSTYWLATRVFYTDGNESWFGVNFFGADGFVSVQHYSYYNIYYMYVRPIVEIPFSAIDFSATDGIYNSDSGWQVKESIN